VWHKSYALPLPVHDESAADYRYEYAVSTAGEIDDYGTKFKDENNSAFKAFNASYSGKASHTVHRSK
jgi:hypothetical protein